MNVKYGALDVIKREYGPWLAAQAESDYNVTLAFDTDKVPPEAQDDVPQMLYTTKEAPLEIRGVPGLLDTKMLAMSLSVGHSFNSIRSNYDCSYLPASLLDTAPKPPLFLIFNCSEITCTIISRAQSVPALTQASSSHRVPKGGVYTALEILNTLRAIFTEAREALIKSVALLKHNAVVVAPFELVFCSAKVLEAGQSAPNKK
jgi:hypothetical protein